MEADYIIKRDQEVIGFYRYNVTLLKGATGRYIISHEGLFTKKATSRSDAMHLLGFEIIRENYRKERDDYKIDLACGEQEIELFIIKDAPARVNYPEALGLRHLAFKVKSVADTVKELNAKGIATESVRLDDYTGKKMTFFHDPDGLPLEIHE